MIIRSRHLAMGAVAVLVALTLVPSALAKPARATRASTSTSGYDISYPQCGAPYPTGPFGVVGVNGGLANDANRCFSSELSWVLSTATGLSSPAQPAASLYINTANPGPGVADWPRSGSSPYGLCIGTWSQSCAYIYGEQRGYYSYGLAYNANAAVAEHNPWWLDIETSNSWAASPTPSYKQLNIAAIQGFATGLKYPNRVPGATRTFASGATGPLGVYSTGSQWNQITGLNAQTTPGAFGGAVPRDWVAGARTLQQAQSNCSAGFTGAKPTLSQYGSGGFDRDVRCP